MSSPRASVLRRVHSFSFHVVPGVRLGYLTESIDREGLRESRAGTKSEFKTENEDISETLDSVSISSWIPYRIN